MQERSCGGMGPRFGKVGAHIQGANDAGCVSVFSHRTSRQDDAITRSPCLTHTQTCRSRFATLAHRTTRSHAVILAWQGEIEAGEEAVLGTLLGQRQAITVPSVIPDSGTVQSGLLHTAGTAHAPAPAHVPKILLCFQDTAGSPQPASNLRKRNVRRACGR